VTVSNVLFAVSVALMVFVWFAPSQRVSSRVRWQYGLTAVWVLTLAIIALLFEMRMMVHGPNP
jgi:surface polysaccharide O-acyltransferase-like enzyme